MSTLRLADAMSRLGTETAFEVLVRAKALEAQGRKIVHLEIGEPDFDTPENVRACAQKAIDDGWTHYGPAPGLPMWPVARCRLMRAALLSVPWVDWLSPWQ